MLSTFNIAITSTFLIYIPSSYEIINLSKTIHPLHPTINWSLDYSGCSCIIFLILWELIARASPSATSSHWHMGSYIDAFKTLRVTTLHSWCRHRSKRCL